MTARLGNALYWAFSGSAGILVLLVLLAAVSVLTGRTHSFDALFFGALFGISALIFWLICRACHYVLGGDVSALWERALLARARRSVEFRNSFAVIALIGVGALGYGVWSEQERNRIPPPPEGFTLDRPAAATPAAPAITAADLSLSDITLGYSNGTYGLHGTVTNNSERPLASVTFQVTLEDCPPADSLKKLPSGWSGPMKCSIVGQEQTTTGDVRTFAAAAVPAGQARTFDAPLTFAHMPPEDPQRLWTWKIVSVKEAFDPCVEGDAPGTCSPVTPVDGD